MSPASSTPNPPYRIGIGFDIHRLEPLAPAGPGKPLIIAGIRIPHDLGPVAHSDGDAVFHAVTDAILGAIGAPDIGQLFPDTDPRHAAADSSIFLREAFSRARAAGYVIANIDVAVILERPRLADHKEAMRRNLAHLLELPLDRVNLKGRTHERLDSLGAGKAIAVHAVALLAAISSST